MFEKKRDYIEYFQFKEFLENFQTSFDGEEINGILACYKYLKGNEILEYIFGDYLGFDKDWDYHQKLIKDEVNPNVIAKIIRNDKLEKLQNIASQTKFNFNQFIEPSLYERCDFINEDKVTLIDYSAFFSSVKCFKYLLMNGANVEKTGKYAIAGGNLEIIHLCEQNHSTFEGGYEAAIEYHRNDIFKYFYKNNTLEIGCLEELGVLCIFHNNYQILLFLIEEDLQIDNSLIITSIETGNLLIAQCFLEKNPISINFFDISPFYWNKELFSFLINNKFMDPTKKNNDGDTLLIYVSEKGNIEIIKLLLNQKGNDINAKNKYGNTALILASSNGNIEMVKLLLEQEGIDINAKNQYGDTALIWASEKGHTEIVKLLLEQKGIDINAQGKYGNYKSYLARQYI